MKAKAQLDGLLRESLSRAVESAPFRAPVAEEIARALSAGPQGGSSGLRERRIGPAFLIPAAGCALWLSALVFSVLSASGPGLSSPLAASITSGLPDLSEELLAAVFLP